MELKQQGVFRFKNVMDWGNLGWQEFCEKTSYTMS